MNECNLVFIDQLQRTWKNWVPAFQICMYVIQNQNIYT